MKLDLGQAWNTALELMNANRDVILVIAGVFLFLPGLAQALLMPGMNEMAADPENIDAVMAELQALYTEYWWVFVLVAIINTLGTLTLLTLLTDRQRPTVAEALKASGMGILSYIAVQILLILGVSLALGIPVGLAFASGSTALIVIAVIAAIVVGFYLMAKFALVTPVIAIDKILNPLAVLKRSWTLTKGNSIRVFAFLFLLILGMGIVFMVVQGVLAIVFAIIGGEVETIGMAIISSIGGAIFAVVFLAALAGVHRQLSGAAHENISETFD